MGNVSLWDAHRVALGILIENLKTRKDWVVGTLPVHGNASSSCPADGNLLHHPETPADEAGLIPNPVYARMQEAARQVDLAHQQQVRKSDPESLTVPHEGQKVLLPSPLLRLDEAGMLVWDPHHFVERIQRSPLPICKELQSTLLSIIRELDLNPLAEDLVLGPTLREAQELIMKEWDTFNKRKTKHEKKKVKRATWQKLKTLGLAKESLSWTNTVEAFLEEEQAPTDKRASTQEDQCQEVDTSKRVEKA
ncbi:hypothetical protein SELMODRAFT_425104 [Selaginella moellendorffii]|uniref:Uncharacterized protein n=1 Tax=Selaginella moellendorffii TaxID=88036 RepID=D8SS12_SELML|nr:hypothetical protein SELMODRAFT_425104 [Selaginella moellendorffii]